jgi:hypothetical protein
MKKRERPKIQSHMLTKQRDKVLITEGHVTDTE